MDRFKKIAYAAAIAACFGSVSLPAHAVTMTTLPAAKAAQVRLIGAPSPTVRYWHRRHRRHHHHGFTIKL